MYDIKLSRYFYDEDVSLSVYMHVNTKHLTSTDSTNFIENRRTRSMKALFM